MLSVLRDDSPKGAKCSAMTHPRPAARSPQPAARKGPSGKRETPVQVGRCMGMGHPGHGAAWGYSTWARMGPHGAAWGGPGAAWAWGLVSGMGAVPPKKIAPSPGKEKKRKARAGCYLLFAALAQVGIGPTTH
jgi:hypothetical protein